ncbi:MAG: diaminopimelate epimerase, partial [Desulfobacteraceae bacterium]|nr:diaminopimelate epimerase [Desulfobacteraceae bacterium]
FSENEKKEFAHLATNTCFGIGSDNFLVIQPCNPKTLEQINNKHGYWPKPPDLTDADYIFRMFEPDGTEAFSCGNGLMCIANYLFRTYDIEFTRIVTQIPTAEPKIVTLGTDSARSMSWVNMGWPKKIPSNLFKPKKEEPYDHIIQMIKELIIPFRVHDLKPFTNDTHIKLKAYIVFIGEPHLVVFSQNDTTLEGFDQFLFPSLSKFSKKSITEKRMNFGTWLVNQIGSRINTKYLDMFPSGMNVNFARPVKGESSNIIEYRCFERGINRETLACGTGALSVSYISRRLGLIQSRRNTIWPNRCRLYNPNAAIQIKEDETGWLLHGYPQLVFHGEFYN